MRGFSLPTRNRFGYFDLIWKANRKGDRSRPTTLASQGQDTISAPLNEFSEKDRACLHVGGATKRMMKSDGANLISSAQAADKRPREDSTSACRTVNQALQERSFRLA